ncbi:heme ABC transporter [Philodulcilactobacillus myokoensis]|uniref:Heme ABC transporter n=1 Tax=Philodulcilactobacillus myokoensis TaxID=2929573 RepID=A0A9W6B1B7_9LACO|nr:AAA family ATPase [Philodulcilactobacillus myokoensis]GLB46304.1 heme ABC transporter [Philodulcilactobacillus myokoensis]
MINVNDLSFSYKNKLIYQKLNFKTANGKLNCIVGPNGVGKSTLLDLIAGITKPSLGKIDPLISKHDVVYQTQGVPFLNEVSGDDAIQMFQSMGGKKIQSNSKLRQIYNDEIKSFADVKFRDMSGGQRRLILVYGMCTLNRKLYLFDEPTSGLDPINSQLVLSLLNSISRDKQVIFTTHNLYELKNLDVNIIFISHRECVFNGSYSQLSKKASDNDIISAYSKILK